MISNNSLWGCGRVSGVLVSLNVSHCPFCLTGVYFTASCIFQNNLYFSIKETWTFPPFYLLFSEKRNKSSQRHFSVAWGCDGGGACGRWRGRGASQSAALVEEFLERLLRFLLPPVRSPSAGREAGKEGGREEGRKQSRPSWTPVFAVNELMTHECVCVGKVHGGDSAAQSGRHCVVDRLSAAL